MSIPFRGRTEGIDPRTPAGRFFFGALASLALRERERSAPVPGWQRPNAGEGEKPPLAHLSAAFDSWVGILALSSEGTTARRVSWYQSASSDRLLPPTLPVVNAAKNPGLRSKALVRF
jgi:hypothetical protein